MPLSPDLQSMSAVHEELRQSRLSFQNFFDASTDMIFMLNENGQVLRANRPALARLFSQDAPMPRLADFLDQEGERRLAALLSAGPIKARQEELYFFPTLGDPLHLDITAFPVWEQGQPVLCCLAKDLSFRLKMESGLVEAERLVIIGKMAAGIAHEVNNPLHIILGNAELMQEMTTDAELQNCIRAIIHNTERAAGIIRQMLELSAPAPLRLGRVDLSRLTLACLTFLKPRLKQVEVDVSGLAPSLPLYGDETLLEQLLLNVLLNALSSMNDKGTLRILGYHSPENDSLRLEVHDSGAGIARENLEKIFDIFFTTRNTEGFGLGLFLCRRIAERHSGLLFAESSPGHGAVLILELPTTKRHLL